MSGTYNLTMGDRGRLVVPAELRDRAGLAQGTPVVMIDTPTGMVLLTRDQLKAMVRSELADVDLVAELLAERRRGASHDAA
jgi:bifunctional DNA-binding transcriptional regulator/antitoxin component of YhaV-PrlF toxin-antitoxin module